MEYLTQFLALCRISINENIIIYLRIPWIYSINKWWLTETADFEPQAPAQVVEGLALSLLGWHIFTLHWCIRQDCHLAQLQRQPLYCIPWAQSTSPHSTWSWATWKPCVLQFQVCCVITVVFAPITSHSNSWPYHCTQSSMAHSTLATVTLQATREISTWMYFFWFIN